MIDIALVFHSIEKLLFGFIENMKNIRAGTTERNLVFWLESVSVLKNTDTVFSASIFLSTAIDAECMFSVLFLYFYIYRTVKESARCFSINFFLKIKVVITIRFLLQQVIGIRKRKK